PGTRPAKINATIKIEPDCLNLASKGELTAFITLPKNYNVRDIDIDTVILEGARALKGTISNRNGGTLIVKFERQDMVNVPVGNAVALYVRGKVIYNGMPVDFEGSDIIRVMNQGNSYGCNKEKDK
ncbi:MAG TPA: hypothetical protein VIO11_00830, partial [Candidatus Methanoperedens sp.]